MDIPIELFAIFLGVALTFMGLGLAKRVPVAIVMAGMFILTIAALTDNIIMGKIPQSSTSSGLTTTYVMVDNPFAFTEWHKVIMALVGVMFMLLGVLYKVE